MLIIFLHTVPNQQADRLGLAPMNSMVLLGMFCILAAVLAFGPLASAVPATFFAYVIRREARRRYAISGNVCSDVLCSLFCAPCSLSQVTRHVFPFKKFWDCSEQGYSVEALTASGITASGDIEQQQQQQQQQIVTGVSTRSRAAVTGAHVC
jgi:Cys-rich protein (TIGR01571 family)